MRYLRKIILISVLSVAACSTQSDQQDDAGQGDTGLPDIVQSDIIQDADSGLEWIEPENHRETALVCAARDRVVGTSENCDDNDCTMGDQGRCRFKEDPEVSMEYCTYDDCSADSDCATDEVCECGNPKDLIILGPGADENRCVPSNCKTDSDCGLAFCKPSPDICGSGKTYGYFCITQSDECLENSDCGSVCTYSVELSRWACDGADCD